MYLPKVNVFVICRPEEKRQTNTTSHDDGRHDGCRCHGPDGLQGDRSDGRQGPVAQQDRPGPVRNHRPEKAHPTAVRRPRNRDGVPPLRPQHAVGRGGPGHGILGPKATGRAISPPQCHRCLVYCHNFNLFAY